MLLVAVVAQQEIQVDNVQQQQPAQAYGLAGYTSVGEWLDGRAGAFFPTRSSLDWFIKQNRRELIESGALIPREGRSGSLIQPDKFCHAVLNILRRRALEKAGPSTVAA